MSGGPPPYLRLSKIAQASGYSRKELLTLLRGANVLEERRGRLLRVSRSRLRERLSDLYDDVWELYRSEREERKRSR